VLEVYFGLVNLLVHILTVLLDSLFEPLLLGLGLVLLIVERAWLVEHVGLVLVILLFVGKLLLD